jgi:hypothetical protein
MKIRFLLSSYACAYARSFIRPSVILLSRSEPGVLRSNSGSRVPIHERGCDRTCCTIDSRTRSRNMFPRSLNVRERIQKPRESEHPSKSQHRLRAPLQKSRTNIDSPRTNNLNTSTRMFLSCFVTARWIRSRGGMWRLPCARQRGPAS